MLRLFFISFCAITALLCAFLIGIASVETKHPIYYKVRSLVYYALGREQTPDRNAIYYHEKISLFEQDERQDYDVVFIGDSLTDGADWQSFFNHYDIANRGINGDTSRGIANRINNITKTGATKAFVMMGVNDLRRGFEITEIIENYQKIVAQLLAANTEVFIQSTLLTRDDSSNDLINALNLKLKAFGASTENVRYIDLNIHLATAGVLDAKYTYDGIHLNGEGYEVWRDAIAPLLTPIAGAYR